jgi:hypothetical protein
MIFLCSEQVPATTGPTPAVKYSGRFCQASLQGLEATHILSAMEYLGHGGDLMTYGFGEISFADTFLVNIHIAKWQILLFQQLFGASAEAALLVAEEGVAGNVGVAHGSLRFSR